MKEYITEEEAAREVEESRKVLGELYAEELKLSNESGSIKDIVSRIEEGVKNGTIKDNWHPSMTLN